MKLTFSTQARRQRTLTRALRAGLAAISLASALAHASLPGTNVGEVTIVMGKAWIEKPGARRELVEVGTKVGVLDRIETASDGHVHVRFVDRGLLSVRPYSTLEVLRYDYNPADPAASAVKLNLVEGEARSISGEAAHKARENYRINTPIAAIGVRGTDFVINADRREVEARINEGAIVVAPFSSQCLADALSPCNAGGQELAYGASQMLQLAADTGNAVLLPASDLPASLFRQAPPEQQPQAQVAANPAPANQAGGNQVASNREERASGELYSESVATLAVTKKIAYTLANNLPGGSGNPGTTNPPPDTTPGIVTPEFTPDVALSAQVLQNNQMLWARTSGVARAQDRITVPLDLALGLESHKGAINNNAYSYVLFRQLSDLPRLQPDLGVVGFALNSAQATYTSNGVIELLDVNKGTLNIDFIENTFATSLAMRSATLGAVDLSAGGRLRDGGFFSAVGATQEMSGAVTLDGKEAGYYFEKTVDTGTLEGLTLWGRQP